jgi:uncharacterized protein YfiM (DUF2279 family)
MIRQTLAIATLLAASSAYADEWTGNDKTQHAIGGAAIGAAITLATKSPAWGCAAATAVGAAKEIYDDRHSSKHTPSWKDFAVTAAAGCVASGLTGLVITPRGVSYSVNLNML